MTKPPTNFAFLIPMLFATAMLVAPAEDAFAKRGGGGKGEKSAGAHATTSHGGGKASVHNSKNITRSGHAAGGDAKRDSSGRIARSQQAKSTFKKQHPCPATGKSTGACPGYVIDHKIALKRGGKDEPSNMQWQTVQDARAKDKWE